MAVSVAGRFLVKYDAGLWCQNIHRSKFLFRRGTNVAPRNYTEISGGKSWSSTKIKRRNRPGMESGNCTCVTYATADKYEMDSFVADILKDHRFSLKKMPLEVYDAANIGSLSHSVLTDPDNPGAMFIFRNGVISLWNIDPTVVESVLKLSHNHAKDIYPVSLVKWESEEMPYTYGPGETRLQGGKVVLNSVASHGSSTLEMFAFSNALCSSVKLGHWEYMLDSLITSLEPIPVSLMKHQRLKYETHSAVLRKIGEILLLRHRVNLQHNLLDLPDVYWDRENLEKLYLNTTRSLNISERVHLMNEKLTYCAHMVELLKTDIHEKRSLRLEMLIVLLISIEVQ